MTQTFNIKIGRPVIDFWNRKVEAPLFVNEEKVKTLEMNFGELEFKF